MPVLPLDWNWSLGLIVYTLQGDREFSELWKELPNINSLVVGARHQDSLKAKVWLVKHVALLKFTTIVNNCTSASVSTMFDWRIVIHGSRAQNAPFFNATSTKNFQTEKDKGSRWPIFELKRFFLGERLICHLPCVDLSWVIRVFRKSLLTQFGVWNLKLRKVSFTKPGGLYNSHAIVVSLENLVLDQLIT